LAWETSGIDEARVWQHAYFEGDKITAMAGYRARSDEAGDPCIVTHPEFRGQGRGTAVAGAVVCDALAQSKLLLYQTLESNSSAVRIAFALGYERYATHIAVRLKGDSPDHDGEGDHIPSDEALASVGSRGGT
jgi:predicted GNAT family acetyltransferase